MGKCQRKASETFLPPHDNGLPSGWCPRNSWLLPRYLDSFWSPQVNDDNMFLGVVFMCFTLDYRILHLKITPEATEDATHFYTLFYNAPPAIRVGFAFIRRETVTEKRYERRSFTR